MNAALKRIALVIFDVDGVLTDGGIYHTEDGNEFKRFDAADGAGIKYLRRCGVGVAFLTGRQSRIVARRAAELGVELVEQNAKQKLPALERILAAAATAPANAAYVGDDLIDIPPMLACAWSAAPASAQQEVRRIASYVTRAPAGHGAAREVCELILRAQGKWVKFVADYLVAGRAWRAERLEGRSP